VIINETTYTKNVARESKLLILKYKKKKVFWFVLMIVSIIFMITIIIYELLKNIIRNKLFCLIGTPLFCMLIISFMVYHISREERQRMQIIYREKVPVKNYEFSDKITMYDHMSGAKIFFEYGQINNVVESKNLIMIDIKGNLSLILRKDGFTQGSWEECKEFILQKCRECK